MPDFLPILPFLIALVGGAALPLLHPRLRLGLRSLVLPALLTLVLLSFVALLPRAPASLEFPSWNGISPYVLLVFRLDLMALLPAIMVSIGLLGLSLVGSEDSPIAAWQDLVLLAATLLILFAGNIVTLVVTWALADWVRLLHTSQRQPPSHARRIFLVNQIGLLVFLMAIVLGSAEAQDLNQESLQLSDVAGTVVLISVAIRLGLFPFHLSWYYAVDEESPDLVWGFLVPVTGSLGALARSAQWLSDSLALPAALWAWFAVALLVAAVFAITRTRATQALLWGAAGGLALAPAAFLAVGPAQRGPVVLWILFGLWTAVLLYLGAERLDLEMPRLPWSRAVAFLGLVTLGSAPLFPGFLPRVELYAGAVGHGYAWFVLLAAGSATLWLVPLWRHWFRFPTSRTGVPAPAEAAGLVILAIPFAVLGLLSLIGFGWLGNPVPPIWAPVAFQFTWPLDLLYAGALLGAVLLPLAASVYLGLVWVESDRDWTWIAPAARPLFLEGVVGRLGRVLVAFARLSHSLSNLVEQHVLGWLIFVALWIAIWLFSLR